MHVSFFCKRNTIQSNYDLRSSDTDLCLPKPNCEFLKKTFRYSGAMQWNHLSEVQKILKPFLLLKEKYVGHEHFLSIAPKSPIVKFLYNSFFICLCDVTLSVYPHREGLKNMPGHGGIRTYDLWNTSPMLYQLSYAVRSVRVCGISELSLVPSISL